jgi:hypothetical protein
MTKAAKARAFLAANPKAPVSQIIAASGLDDRRARRVRNEFHGSNPSSSAAPTAQTPAPHVSFEEKGVEGVASSVSTRIQSLEQLLKATAVDLTVWEVERHVINKWEVAMKEEAKSGKVSAIVEPLIQVKAWLRRKTPQAVGLAAALADQIADVRRHPARPSAIRYAKTKGGCLAELDIFDLHYGKLCWAAESGEDYDVKIAERVYKEAVLRLRDSACQAYPIDRFLFPIGNDYFNVDNAARTTTGGTPQDEDGRWQRTFTNGRRLVVWAIDTLREKAPVDVVIVPGNHDFERSFYLGDALECWYRQQKDVSIDNTPKTRKYYPFGATLIGLTHSDKEQMKDLPLTMAVEAPELWAASNTREFHCGHLHHKRVRDFQPVLEHKSVTVRHLSSLSSADAWHAGKGYRSQRAAQAFIHHPVKGLLAELCFSP